MNNDPNKIKHPVDDHVGRRIRQRRWMLAMSQKELGSAVGVKFQQVQKYETGSNRVSASRLWDIAVVLKVPITFFFEGIKIPEGVHENSPEYPTDVEMDKQMIELLRLFNGVPENQRTRLFDLTRSLSLA